MSNLKWAFVTAASILAGSLVVCAADMPTTAPGKHATTKASIKVEPPYSKLDDLSDVQKSKLAEIHKKYLSDLKALKDQEDTDSRAVLTDDQKAEVDKIAAEKKEKMSEKNKTKHAAKSTTAPSND